MEGTEVDGVAMEMVAMADTVEGADTTTTAWAEVEAVAEAEAEAKHNSRRTP